MTTYSTSSKLIVTHSNVGYYDSLIIPFTVPYTQGQRNPEYISPTFQSGDYFSNYQTSVNRPTSTSPLSKSPLNRSHHNETNQPQLKNQNIKPIFHIAQQKKSQSPLQQPIRNNNQPKQNPSNLYEQYARASKSPLRAKGQIENYNSNHKEVQLNQTVNKNNISSYSAYVSASPNNQSRCLTPSKFAQDNTSQKKNIEDKNSTQFDFGTDKLLNNPFTNYFNDKNVEEPIQQICTSCLNQDLILDKKNKIQQTKQKDREDIQKSLEQEHKLLQMQSQQLLMKQDSEKRRQKEGYQEFLEKQKNLVEQQKDKKEQARQVDQQLAQKNIDLQKQKVLEENENKIKFRKGLETQLQEKEKQNIKALQFHSFQNSLPTTLEIGHTSRIQYLQKQNQDKQQMWNLNLKAIDDKIKEKEQNVRRDRIYSEWAKQQNQQDLLKIQQEKQLEEMKKKTFTQGITKQIMDQNEKFQQIKKFEAEQLTKMKPYEPFNEIVTQYEDCNECHQKFPKQFLSKVKRKLN